jgi:hypothetical protein
MDALPGELATLALADCSAQCGGGVRLTGRAKAGHA